MQAVNNAHQHSLNTIAFGPTTSIPQSLYSDSFSKTLATSVDSIGATKTLFDIGELQNGQLKPTNFTRDMEMPTKCLVCEQPTNGCHYDVPSCNGCKTFFRRFLLASKTYACNFNGMCSKMNGINPCRACRFDQCVLVGMNHLAVKFPTSVDVAKICDKVENSRTGPVFEETIEDKIIQSLVYVELKVRKIRESSRCLNETVIFRSIRELLESDHENALAHADQYPKELKWPLSIDEALRLDGSDLPYWLISDLFLSIEMARTMPVFPQLDYKDQEALLKQAVLASALLGEAFYSYQMKSETFVMPNGFLPILLPQVHGSTRRADMIKRISCRTMLAISRIQITMEESVLLKAIIYSHSAIHGLSETGRVLLERESIRYSKTLMKHLQSRMGAGPGAKKYAEIVSFVDCLFHCAQQLRELHVYVTTVVRPPICCPPYMETIMYA
ncbi:zinc finger, c4 type (two domains) domain-containing protein [Ditylenchus destructor]|nr:zinc finger, c4 type (two domains) domain-containing protein [Ditylenchus destructor]